MGEYTEVVVGIELHHSLVADLVLVELGECKALERCDLVVVEEGFSGLSFALEHVQLAGVVTFVPAVEHVDEFVGAEDHSALVLELAMDGC